MAPQAAAPPPPPSPPPIMVVMLSRLASRLDRDTGYPTSHGLDIAPTHELLATIGNLKIQGSEYDPHYGLSQPIE